MGKTELFAHTSKRKVRLNKVGLFYYVKMKLMVKEKRIYRRMNILIMIFLHKFVLKERMV